MKLLKNVLPIVLHGVCLLFLPGQLSAQTMTSAEPPQEEFIIVEKMPEVDLGHLSRMVIYPEEAKRYNIEGKSTIQVLIDTEGKPVRAVVLKSAHPLLDTAAISAVMSGIYTPAYQSGKPIAVWMAIPVNFKLRDESRSIFNTNEPEPKKEPVHRKPE
ncbi:MAG TPA: energy transducer TonB [Patescibacteria group bacterium]|nr:energy transducer TonB [Patescibacteria group bacterium]